MSVRSSSTESRPLMSTSAPSASASTALYGSSTIPVLHVQPGKNIQQRRMPGHQSHQLCTIFLPNQAGQTGQMVPGQANAQYLGGQYRQDPMTSPPPNSIVPGAFYPPTYTSFGTPQMAYGGYGQIVPSQASINTPGGPFIYQGAQAAAMVQQQQQQAAAAAAMAYQMGQQQQQQQQQGGPPEFGTPSVPGGGGGGGPQSVPSSRQTSTANYSGMQTQMGAYALGCPVGPPQQQQPGAAVRRRNMVEIVDPYTKENVVEQVLKAKEETDQRQHEQYEEGDMWKPPQGSQTTCMETAEDQPSRSQSATPQSMNIGQLQRQRLNMSQIDDWLSAVRNFYNAIKEAAIAPNQPNQSSPPQSLTSSSHQDERVILPPQTICADTAEEQPSRSQSTTAQPINDGQLQGQRMNASHDSKGTLPSCELITPKSTLKHLADPDGKRKYSREFMREAAKLPSVQLRPKFDTTRWSQDQLDNVFELGKSKYRQRKQSKVPLSLQREQDCKASVEGELEIERIPFGSQQPIVDSRPVTQAKNLEPEFEAQFLAKPWLAEIRTGLSKLDEGIAEFEAKLNNAAQLCASFSAKLNDAVLDCALFDSTISASPA